MIDASSITGEDINLVKRSGEPQLRYRIPILGATAVVAIVAIGLSRSSARQMDQPVNRPGWLCKSSVSGTCPTRYNLSNCPMDGSSNTYLPGYYYCVGSKNPAMDCYQTDNNDDNCLPQKSQDCGLARDCQDKHFLQVGNFGVACKEKAPDCVSP